MPFCIYDQNDRKTVCMQLEHTISIVLTLHEQCKKWFTALFETISFEMPFCIYDQNNKWASHVLYHETKTSWTRYTMILNHYIVGFMVMIMLIYSRKSQISRHRRKIGKNVWRPKRCALPRRIFLVSHKFANFSSLRRYLRFSGSRCSRRCTCAGNSVWFGLLPHMMKSEHPMCFTTK